MLTGLLSSNTMIVLKVAIVDGDFQLCRLMG